MPDIFEPAVQSGYLMRSLMETERVEYEGVYHKPSELVIEFVLHQGHVNIMGARLYSLSGKYLGWWPSFNCPSATLFAWRFRIENDELKYRPVFQFPASAEDALEHL